MRQIYGQNSKFWQFWGCIPTFCPDKRDIWHEGERTCSVNVYVKGNVVPVGVEDEGATDVGGCWWCERTAASVAISVCSLQMLLNVRAIGHTSTVSESLATSKERLQASSVVRWGEPQGHRESPFWNLKIHPAPAQCKNSRYKKISHRCTFRSINFTDNAPPRNYDQKIRYVLQSVFSTYRFNCRSM